MFRRTACSVLGYFFPIRHGTDPISDQSPLPPPPSIQNIPRHPSIYIIRQQHAHTLLRFVEGIDIRPGDAAPQVENMIHLLEYITTSIDCHLRDGNTRDSPSDSPSDNILRHIDQTLLYCSLVLEPHAKSLPSYPRFKELLEILRKWRDARHR